MRSSGSPPADLSGAAPSSIPLKQVLPPDASSLITQTIQQISARAVFGMGALLAVVYAAWGALNGTWAMITGLKKAYEVEEKSVHGGGFCSSCSG
ncbi:MAG TPA: hypothetical protein VHZ07_23010 [Bryobacteraceae bacterium]|nr:hypothetical protein [Bryobacteraceae bacterium]